MTSNNFWEEFDEYIQGEEWKEKSREIRREVGECEVCGSTKNLICHHLTYNNFKNETRGDIQVLCYDCHNKIPHTKRQMFSPLKEQVKRTEKLIMWKMILPSLPTKLKEKYGFKETLPPLRQISKPKLKDYKKQVYYENGEFKNYTFMKWIKKMIKTLKSVTKHLENSPKRIKERKK